MKARDYVIVVVILGALAAVLVPGYQRQRAGSYLTFCNSHLGQIGQAFEMYSTDFSGKYPTALQQLTPNYLKTLPECDAAGKVTYTFESVQVPLKQLICKTKHLSPPYRAQCQKNLSRLNKQRSERGVCPDSEQEYTLLTHVDTYRVYCKGSYHSSANVMKDHPEYDGVSGLHEGTMRR